MASERRSRRRESFDANRGVMAVSNSDQEKTGSPIVIGPDDTDEGADQEEAYCSPKSSRESSLKRKAEDVELPEVTQPKQGRPRDTGHYVGRAAALEVSIEKKKEEAKIEQERILLSMSAGRIYSSLLNDVEDAVEKFESITTADVAERVRHHMTEVARVAKTSRNPPGRIPEDPETRCGDWRCLRGGTSYKGGSRRAKQRGLKTD